MNTAKNINKPKAFPKKTVILFVSFFLIISLIIVSISIYVGWNLTRPKRDAINDSPSNYGLIYEDISFHSLYDNISLKGWWIPSQKSKNINQTNETVIFSHGYGDNRSLRDISVLNLAQKLVQAGYNVLVFDFRASGKSEGSISSIGQFEKYDVLSAIKFAKSQKHSNNIHLIGWSMGAVSSILAGTESEDVKTIIADSPFANLRNYLKDNLPHWSHLPSFPFTNIILSTIPIMEGVDVDSVRPIDAVANLKNKRLLLIHSKNDKAIPYHNSELIYKAVPNKKLVDIWITKKAGHIRSYLTNKNEYEKKILSFLKNN
ncbi:alpha/beta hydrolase [Clostridium ganghwense]|uniref:Alpha/beta hydrolase n=1 Tax=Clostridium ganghwense TaxID=312089 RepID=A0ABT4CJM2_9CLOT|nr:alpha/beta hydrolase [Clostridium ganghwense]MCY6369247.1 alpha/beta hydrolase [Clostridium ganghwense]